MKFYSNASNCKRAAVGEIAKALEISPQEVKENFDQYAKIEQREEGYRWHRVSNKVNAPEVAVNGKNLLQSVQDGVNVNTPITKTEPEQGSETMSENEVSLEQAKAEEAAAKKAEKEAKAAAKKAEKEAEREAKKAEREAAKAAKQAERDAKKAEREAAKAEKEAAKEANRMPEQNGVRAPKPESKCGQVWAICERLSSELGAVVPVASVLKDKSATELNQNNVRCEYARWRKFHGITGRHVEVKEAAEPVAE